MINIVMKAIVFLLTLLLLGATPTKTTELPELLRKYASWKQITPNGYSIPGNLATMCVAAHHPGEEIEESDSLLHVPIRVFVNDKAIEAIYTKNPFAEGSILVKEKLQRTGLGVIAHHGVMIRRTKGWEFSYYPSHKESSFEACATCHNSAQHDFVFAPYLKKK